MTNLRLLALHLTLYGVLVLGYILLHPLIH
jgi:hypothetical protein